MIKMKKSILYSAALLVAATGFVSCDDNFEQAPFELFVPHATMKPNTTIEELKAAFDQDVNFYATEVGTKENGEHYIVKGRIVSSDEAGNIFKKIAIQDETGGAIFSINASKLYETYRYGQELVVDVTGLWYGNYGAGIQIGSKPTSGDPATSAPDRMAESIWTAHAQTDGLANVDKIHIYELSVAEALDIRADRSQMLQWQGRLVRITDVRFETPGTPLAVANQTNNTSYIVGTDGKRMALNTSGYSTFGSSTKAPKGTGNVLAVLTNYTSGWQLQLNDLAGLEGFTPWSDEPEPEIDPVGAFTADFEAGVLPEGWTSTTVEGSKDWYFTSFNNNFYAAMTGYKGTAPFDAWLISQPIDASLMTAKTLSFETQVNGYGSTTTKLEVFILDNVDPSKAKLTPLTCTLATAPASGYSSWANSGEVSLAAAKGKFYIGWRYTATTDANYATWCVDNITVK